MGARESVLLRNEEGEPLCFHGVILDITNQKTAQEALRGSEQRLLALADAAFEGILINDQGVILVANRALTDMFGYEVSEVIGRSTVEFVVPEHRDLVEQKIASGSEEPYEVTRVRKDGTLLNLRLEEGPTIFGNARCASSPYGTSPIARRQKNAWSTGPSTIR